MLITFLTTVIMSTITIVFTRYHIATINHTHRRAPKYKALASLGPEDAFGSSSGVNGAHLAGSDDGGGEDGFGAALDAAQAEAEDQGVEKASQQGEREAAIAAAQVGGCCAWARASFKCMHVFGGKDACPVAVLVVRAGLPRL